jgi:predicted small lipoprotein YifL
MRLATLLLSLAGCGPTTPLAEGPSPARTAAPEEECDSEPSRTKVTESLEAVAARVQACTPDRTKALKVAVTFESGGSVTRAEVLGPSGDPRRYPTQGTVMNLAEGTTEHDGTIAGTPAAECVVEALRAAHTHSFCDATLFAIYAFRAR